VQAGIGVLGLLLGLGALTAALAGRGNPGAVLGCLAIGVIALLVALQVVLFRVVIHPDRVETRGLTGTAVLPLAGLLRVERTHTSSRTTMPFPFVRSSGWTRTIIGRTPSGATRRATVNEQYCDTSASDPAIDALVRQFPHLDAAVQGSDVPWVRWWDTPLGGSRTTTPAVAPPPDQQQGWGPGTPWDRRR
jgi:hypothetical protein